MVAAGIFVSISLVATLWLTGLSDLWQTSSTQSDLRVTTQQVMNRMVSELRSATRTAAASPPNIVIPAAPNNTTLTFYLPTDINGNGTIVDAIGNIEWDLVNPIQYVYVPAQRRLERQRGADTIVLANDVQSVTFEHAGINPALYQNEVRISLQLQRTTPQRRVLSGTSTEIVKLRN
jgi:hypothetical protein